MNPSLYTNHQEVRKCDFCGKPIKGRQDKRYCNVDCKNNFNSRLRSAFRADAHSNVKQIMKVIRMNYEIMLKYNLKALEKDQGIYIDKEQLINKGFDDRFFTSIATDRWENIWKCCFDCGFRELKDGQLELGHFPEQADL